MNNKICQFCNAVVKILYPATYCHRFPLNSKRMLPGVVLMCSLFMLIPSDGYSFNFGSMIDEVGSAVKTGINSLEESVGKNTQHENKPAAEKQQKQTSAVPDTESRKDTQKSGADKKSADQYGKTKTTAPSVDTGGSVFSKEPIDPDNPPAAVTVFTAGDHIYGMLKGAKTWKVLTGNSNYIIIWLFIDGKQKVYKSVGLNRPELMARDYFVIDIAPDPSRMTSYRDRDIVFPEKDGFRFGPELFTKYLSELSPGDHTFRLEVKAFNKIYAAGEFSISGDDYSMYGKLLADIKDSSGKMQKMPKVGKTDMQLQNEMVVLLNNAGWPEIRRLLIVDKDWWIDRVDGGDSPVKSRHIEAVAAARNTDGSYYFRHVTFLQPMLISGEWGKLELSHSGEKKPIPEENIDQ